MGQAWKLVISIFPTSSDGYDRGGCGMSSCCAPRRKREMLVNVVKSLPQFTS
jgi:hypothetical protein